MTQDVNEIQKNLYLVADQGWRANFTLFSGEEILKAFVTAIDKEKNAFLIEKMGERHKKPRLIWLKDVQKIVPDWSH